MSVLVVISGYMDRLCPKIINEEMTDGVQILFDKTKHWKWNYKWWTREWVVQKNIQKKLTDFLKIKGEIQTTNQEDDLENVFLLDLQSSLVQPLKVCVKKNWKEIRSYTNIWKN